MAKSTPTYVDCKRCTKCKRVKALSEFGRRKRGGDGYHPQCAECKREAERKAYRARAARPRPTTPSVPKPVLPAGHKFCAKTGECHPLSAFHRNPRTGAYGSYCIPCSREACRESYRRASDRDGRSTAPQPLPVVDGRKKCGGECGEIKPLSEFYRRGDGYRRECKACRLDAEKRRRQDPEFRSGWLARRGEHYRANRESIRAAAREARKSRTPDQIERERQVGRAWYEANRERVYESNARWRTKNPERHRANARAWAARHREANPDYVREVGRRAASRRRALERELPSEPYTLADLIERDGPFCVLCHDELDAAVTYPDPWSTTIEHLECLSWPNSAGDVLSNVAVAHFTCNSSRNNRPHPAAARKRAELLASEQAVNT